MGAPYVAAISIPLCEPLLYIYAKEVLPYPCVIKVLPAPPFPKKTEIDRGQGGSGFVSGEPIGTRGTKKSPGHVAHIIDRHERAEYKPYPAKDLPGHNSYYY